MVAELNTLLNSYVKTLIPTVMLSENGTFRRQLDHVGGALMMGLVPLEETGKSLLLFLLSALSVYNEKIDICKLVRGLSLL